MRCAKETGAFVTAEDHNIYGGLGSAVAEALASARPRPIEFIGVKDVFGMSGEPEELAEAYRADRAASSRARPRRSSAASRKKDKK